MSENTKMTQVELHLKASNLKNKDYNIHDFGRSDPFFTVSFENKQLFKSNVIFNNLNPEWELAKFEIPESAVGKCLQIEIKDEDKAGTELLAKFDVEYPFRKGVRKCDGGQSIEVLNDYGSVKEDCETISSNPDSSSTSSEDHLKGGCCGCFGF